MHLILQTLISNSNKRDSIHRIFDSFSVSFFFTDCGDRWNNAAIDLLPDLTPAVRPILRNMVGIVRWSKLCLIFGDVDCLKTRIQQDGVLGMNRAADLSPANSAQRTLFNSLSSMDAAAVHDLETTRPDEHFFLSPSLISIICKMFNQKTNLMKTSQPKIAAENRPVNERKSV